MAIFGIKEVPTDGVEFDTADFAYSNVEAGSASGPASAPAAGASTTDSPYVPPSPAEQSGSTAWGPATPHQTPAATTTTTAPDLLDDYGKANATTSNALTVVPQNNREIHGLD